MKYEYEYAVSPRVVLRPGDKFRVKGGPYFRGSSGELSMVARGPFTFVRVSRRRSLAVIEAFDKFGHFAPLHVEGRRRSPCKEIVTRPYRVTGRVRVHKEKKAG